MPAPYSDNMYSDMGHDAASASAAGDDREGGHDDALSPTDGYFHASETSDAASSSQHGPGFGQQQYPGVSQQQQQQHHHQTSSNVPFVPNVLVEDPSLQDKSAAKAKEAEEERRINNATTQSSAEAAFTPHSQSNIPSQGTQAMSSTSSAAFTGNSHTTSPTPSSPTFVTSPTHHHRRSVEEDGPQLYTGRSTRLPFSYNPSETTSTSLNHPSSPSQTHHQSHLDAPPAYSPSPSSPPSGNTPQGYQTFAPTSSGNNNTNNNDDDHQDASQDTMGVPEEHQALLPRQPQSMGGSPGGPPASRWQKVKNAVHSPNTRKNIRTLLGIAVILSIFFAIFGSISFSTGYHSKIPKIIDNDPVKEPIMGGERDLDWQPNGACRNTPHKFDRSITSLRSGSGYSLEIIQRIARNDHRRGPMPRVSGQLLLRPSKESEGTVEIEIISNDEKLRPSTEIHADGGRQIVEIITPRALDWWDYQSQAPCVQMRVTIYVPHNAYLDDLKLDLVHLDVEIVEGLVMGVVDGPTIKTVAGNVRTPSVTSVDDDLVPYSLQSRRIVIETVSGDIKGWFPLYDLLQVKSASGNIEAQIAPKAADKESAKEAKLEVKSISGDVKLEEPLKTSARNGKLGKKLPPRDYQVDIATASGGITANIVMTSNAKVESVSGDLALRILPLLTEGSKTTSLTTDTKSGNTRLNIYDPVAIALPDAKAHAKDVEIRTTDGPALANFETKHSSISGNFKLYYPTAWVGKFRAESMSGDILASGKDVKITRRGRGFGKFVEGEKGEGESFIKINSISGDVELMVGE